MEVDKNDSLSLSRHKSNESYQKIPINSTDLNSTSVS